MKFVKVKNYEEVSQLGFELVKAELENNKKAVINFTTGYSPKGLIEKLVASINDGLDVSEATFMNLDEYVIAKDNSLSVHSFMHENLYDKIESKPKNYFLLDGESEDFDAEIKDYKEKLQQYPADIQILGLGTNGHVGANEPGASFEKKLYLSDLADASRERHTEQYDMDLKDVPTQMLTLGMKDVMKAKTPILMVSGKAKAQALRDLIYEGVSEEFPASILKTHENFICIYDEDAGSLL